ncbi:LOW QUALITY PROTEIN: tumor protein p53-inducible nuclear protein 1 [Toxotes jaculatrix]|uniref:LOW QUALITY PROTEIN: tumor protein p53-inducible nuclear protein 1 n=1 Tax=Toxotes jaculatrix TaxID=941984 RepID=UPI001B3B0D2A|nr:LOW QUALITY PROTEIN: tumor protein p53-inducible nuclear protein 1 [Toxotes jaculatrix]
MTKVPATLPRRRPVPRASSSLPQPHALAGRPGMFQRFASALFGDDVEELSQCSRPGDSKEEEEEDEDWILVNYLAEACSSQCGDGLSGSTAGHEEEEEEEEDLVMVPSPVASPPVRYASCTSLNSTADTDPDGGAEEEDEEEEESGFLRLDACSLEESWFVTPPPCFTGRSSQPVLLETSPLENLLIEHPSMSVYAHHSPPRLTLDPLQRSLDRELDFLSSNMSGTPTASGGKEKARRTLDGPRHRPEVAVVQRRSGLHSSCYAAALSARSGLLQQRSGNATQHTQPLSRNALRRLNLLRPPKANTMHLHQPSQRHLNF